MPVKYPDVCVFDTRADYNVKVVSHGIEIGESGYKPLADGAKISFAENALENFTQLDERNLINCQQLNLY